MADAIAGGMLLMYLIVGAYLGFFAIAQRRGLAVLLFMLLWPVFVIDAKFFPRR